MGKADRKNKDEMAKREGKRERKKNAKRRGRVKEDNPCIR